jgi:GTP-binding protein
MTLPILAILGRPNVGKSTLFNRLAGKRLALVDDQPGVTRDRRYADGAIADLKFRLVDTAGMEKADENALESRMFAQTKAAMDEADVLLFVVDARAGVTPIDQHFARIIRASNKPVILIANKAESTRANAAGDIYTLGFKQMVLLSAEHGEGMGDLYEVLAQYVEHAPEEEKKAKRTRKKTTLHNDETGEDEIVFPERIERTKPLNMVVLGRPNAGKSTLINALLGEERLLTGPEAGITRDAIAVPFDFHGTPVLLHDTAGMRKRSNVQGKIEKLAVSDSIRALTFAEVVVVLLDATAPMEKQDATLASLVEREGRACVIGLNKWDLVKTGKKEFLEEIQYMLNKQLSQLAGVAVVPISATKKTGLNELMNACFTAREVWDTRVPTSQLNRWLEGTITNHSPPLVKGRRLKIKYITQVKARPPTFHLFCNMADEFPEAYLRYLTSHLRTSFNMEGTPIRLVLKESNNPFEKHKKRINR